MNGVTSCHSVATACRLSRAEPGHGTIASGAEIISELVHAELVAHFAEQGELERFLDDTGLQLNASEQAALFEAGKAWSEHIR